MFGKKPPPDALAERVRALSSRAPVEQKAEAPRPPRRNVFRNASVTLDSGARYTVAIKDLSAGGVRIEFFQDLPLEGEFLLSDPVTKLRRRVRVSWRKEHSAGLAFVD